MVVWNFDNFKLKIYFGFMQVEFDDIIVGGVPVGLWEFGDKFWNQQGEYSLLKAFNCCFHAI